MLDRALIAAIALAQTLLAATLVLDKTTSSGRVILSLTGSHGIHSGDLPILACWLLGTAACAVLWVRQDP